MTDDLDNLEMFDMVPVGDIMVPRVPENSPVSHDVGPGATQQPSGDTRTPPTNSSRYSGSQAFDTCPECLRDTLVCEGETPSGTIWACTHCGFRRMA